MKKHLLILFACLASTLQLSAQMQWRNPLAESFPTVHGQAWQDELQGTYYRLPEKAKAIVRKPLWDLSRNSAGLSIVFRSNAPEIKVRYHVTEGFSMAHMPSTGKSGLDLYATDAHGRQRWCAARYSFGDTITYTYSNLSYVEDAGHGYEYQLLLPPYNEVTWLEIGVPQDAKFSFLPVSNEKPLVIYGTSIAQGACASRPGMTWGSILEREMQHPVINLGFSGNGQLEDDFFTLLTEIDAKLYIIDCMPNMTNNRTEWIYGRTMNGVKKLREKSRAPILLVEHSGYTNDLTSSKAEKSYRDCNEELKKAYQALLAEGVEGLYYLTHAEIGLSMDAMVEGVHPSDLGMRQYADAYIRKIKEILHEDCDARTVFHPCTQQRDPYNWKERHEQVLKSNQEKAPEIVLIGNSITHYWAGNPNAHIVRGEDSWKKLFKEKVVRNLGFGYDRIENALWRIYHGELDGYDAKKVILLMGTNNLDKNSDDEIINGIHELVRAVSHRQPFAIIYVAGILPRHGKEERIAHLNQALQASLQNERVTYIDMSSELIQPDGKIIKELFTDGLHPNQEGYRRVAKMLEKKIDPTAKFGMKTKEKIYKEVDVAPEFPGGLSELMKFIENNFHFPIELSESAPIGRVYVQAVILKDGTIADAKVVKSVDPLIDEEALRIIGLMPKWTPGKVKGKAVACRYNIPVSIWLK
jgi:lysophospholipase L1-like esterase